MRLHPLTWRWMTINTRSFVTTDLDKVTILYVHYASKPANVQTLNDCRNSFFWYTPRPAINKFRWYWITTISAVLSLLGRVIEQRVRPSRSHFQCQTLFSPETTFNSSSVSVIFTDPNQPTQLLSKHNICGQMPHRHQLFNFTICSKNSLSSTRWGTYLDAIPRI